MNSKKENYRDKTDKTKLLEKEDRKKKLSEALRKNLRRRKNKV